MAEMNDEEFKMYQKYGPNYREYMRFGYGRNQNRSRNQFNAGGGFYHTDPVQTQKYVRNIMGTPPPENSPYLSDYMAEYEETRKRVLQLEELMNSNQFQYSEPDMSFEDFYNQYYNNFDYGGGNNNAGVTEVIVEPTSISAPAITTDTSLDNSAQIAVKNFIAQQAALAANNQSIVNTTNQAYQQVAANKAANKAAAAQTSAAAPDRTANWNAPTIQPILTAAQKTQSAANNQNIVNTTNRAYKQVAANKKSSLNSYIPRYERS